MTLRKRKKEKNVSQPTGHFSQTHSWHRFRSGPPSAPRTASTAAEGLWGATAGEGRTGGTPLCDATRSPTFSIARLHKPAALQRDSPVDAPTAVAPLRWACPHRLRTGGLGRVQARALGQPAAGRHAQAAGGRRRRKQGAACRCRVSLKCFNDRSDGNVL